MSNHELETPPLSETETTTHADETAGENPDATTDDSTDSSTPGDEG